MEGAIFLLLVYVVFWSFVIGAAGFAMFLLVRWYLRNN